MNTIRLLLATTLITFLVSALPAGEAEGLVPPPSAPGSVTGDITVTWNDARIYMVYFLQERNTFGYWTDVSASTSKGSITLSREPGIYVYRVIGISLTANGHDPAGTTLYSPSITVTVLPSAPGFMTTISSVLWGNMGSDLSD